MSVSSEAKLVPADSVMTRTVGDELVLLNLGTELYFGLDAVGTTMWSAICETGTLAGAEARLQDIYDVDHERLGNDLRELVDQLIEQELLEIRSD